MSAVSGLLSGEAQKFGSHDNFFSIGFLVGFMVSNVLLGVVGGACNAVIVLYAERYDFSFFPVTFKFRMDLTSQLYRCIIPKVPSSSARITHNIAKCSERGGLCLRHKEVQQRICH